MILAELIQKEIVKSKIKELDFAKLVGGKMASKEDDYFNHTDIKIEAGIDLKGIKKIRRSDDSPNENYHWVEIKNTAGYKGWLYAGTNEWVAFETKNWIAICKKENIRSLINLHLINVYATSPLPYHLYKRKDRNDLLTLVPTLDLMGIATEIIKKAKYNR